MGRAFGFLALIVTVAVGFYLYGRQAKGIVSGAGSPHTAIDITAVRNDLIGIANAERRYWVSNARYGSLEELRANGDQIPNRAAYAYTVDASEAAFKIIATYSGSDSSAPRRISINESMTFETE